MLYDYSRVYAEMSHTVSIIHDLLSVFPEQNLLGQKDASDEILEIIDNPDDLNFNPIDKTHADFTVGAVDGGQGTVIRNRVFWAGVYRAGFVEFKNRERIGEFSTPMKMVNLTPTNYSGIYKEHYLENFGSYPEKFPDFSGTLGRLRQMHEMVCLGTLLDRLEAGDLLLVDGSLRVGPDDDSGFLDIVLRRAKDKNVDVAGITKSSSLLWKAGANLTAVVKKNGDLRHKNKSWFARIDKSRDSQSNIWLGKIYVARLNGFSDLAFRVDLSKCNVLSPGEVFAKLSAVSDDSYFLGYPYPLAAVHRMVRLSDDELLGFSLRLKDLAFQAGVEENEWEMLFSDYHNVLNHDLRDRKLRL